MPITTIGDLSQHFRSLQQTGNVKSRLATLAQEMSTGQVSDIAKHLGGQTTEFTALNHEIALLETFDTANGETEQLLDAMQLALQRTESQRQLAANDFLGVTMEVPRAQADSTSARGLVAFEDAITGLNASHAGRSLFAGTSVDQAPLADPDAMITSIAAAAAGATNAGAIIAAVDNWFDASGGGFETLGYQGDQQYLSRKTGPNANTDISVTARDSEIRETLKGFAYAAMAHHMSGALGDRDVAELLISSGIKLQESAMGLSQVQGRLGAAQEKVSNAQSLNASQLSAFEIARSDLVVADPFETATKLQDVQTQLETHFAVTARLSQLNLVDFLR